ncbi:MAG: biopolymer transporter ExbD [Pseudomonadota bacterium]
MRISESSQRPRRQADLIALINVVFLMLIFFLVTSTLRQFTLGDVQLVQVGEGVAGPRGPRTVLLQQDGQLVWRGDRRALEAMVERLKAARAAGTLDATLAIVADRRASAPALMALVGALNEAGFRNLTLITQRAKR